LLVLEDSAHAIGSELEGRKLGTWGAIGCYSFFSNKNMTTGEGGMLVTDDDSLAERLHIMRSHGMTSLSWDRHRGHASGYDVVALGYNYRIDELRSAIGCVQLRKLPAGNERRRQLTSLYRELCGELVPQVSLPFEAERGTSCYHILSALLPPDVDRFRFMGGMRKRGIQTSNHYPPVHRFKIYFEDWQARGGPLPVTEEVAACQVTLPLYPTMRDEQVEWVAQAVKETLQEISS
jgi:dTDP-4-amino-4,6-dideoxygalactose transaminase